MANITRYDPLNDIARFNPFMDIDDVFNRFMLRPFARTGLELEPQIRMDVKEVNGEYRIDAEIPGVKKDDIHVSIDGKRVSISAEVKQEKEVKEGQRLICCERSYGMTSRSFTLADEIDQGKVQAKYNNGILELTLPKKPGAARKEIPVS